jgi:hypothetical protein
MKKIVNYRKIPISWFKQTEKYEKLAQPQQEQKQNRTPPVAQKAPFPKRQLPKIVFRESPLRRFFNRGSLFKIKNREYCKEGSPYLNQYLNTYLNMDI